MSIVVAVKNTSGIAIAADTLVTSDRIIISAHHRVEPTKFLRCGDSIMGFVGTSFTLELFRCIIERSPEKFKLAGRKEIFETFLDMPDLLESAYKVAVEEDGNSCRSVDINIILANPNGIFEVSSSRLVVEHTQYWAIGCGAELALGAMHALYSRCGDAWTIATAAVEAACEFDANCGLPVESCVVTEPVSTTQEVTPRRKKMNGPAADRQHTNGRKRWISTVAASKPTR